MAVSDETNDWNKSSLDYVAPCANVSSETNVWNGMSLDYVAEMRATIRGASRSLALSEGARFTESRR